MTQSRASFFAYQTAVSDLDQELFRLKQEQKALSTAGSRAGAANPDAGKRTVDSD